MKRFCSLRRQVRTVGWRTAFGVALTLAPLRLAAQEAARETYIGWNEFVEAYFDDDADGNAAQTALERLEELHAAPLNLNRATAADLLRLPFLSPAQADSILAYRERKKAFQSLGELQFVRGLGRTERRWLSLFVTAGPRADAVPGWRERLWHGRHEVTTRLDVPLYRRAGQRVYPPEELREHPDRVYLGNGLAHTLRYRYRWRDDVAYGVTLQKDAGEPFLAEGNYPYDYVSLYVSLRFPSGRWRLLVGDFNVSLGQGLLLGTGSYNGRTAAVESGARRRSSLRPHTSTDEYDFLRGAAVSVRLGQRWRAVAFASGRRMDATLENDSVRALQTDGLHRTQTELRRRRAVGCLTGGAALDYTADHWTLGAGGYALYYRRPVAPPLRDYNRYYLRGHTAAGASAHYAWTAGRWSAQGELALDRRGHAATTHRLRFEPADGWALTLQGRYFSPRYVAPLAAALQQGSRVQNEGGLLAGVRCSQWAQQEWLAYVDLFRFPRTTYRADGRSQGAEAFLQGRFYTRGPVAFLVRYKLRTRQENIAGTDGRLQYVWTHRLRLQTDYDGPRLSLHGTVDVAAAGSQTERTQWGWMAAARASSRGHGPVRASGFAALFFTDNYDCRLFAYEPQLRYAGGFPSFAYHGFRLVALADWTLFPWLSLGARAAWTHYFNRSVISSGTQQIDGPDQADVSLQLRLTL